MLKALNLTHKFDYTLFNDINLDIKPATTTAIMGVSGSGKSTILHILSTLLPPYSGEVIYNNKSLYQLSNSELLKIRRYDFGIIFQAHYLFKGFNGFENIELATILSGQKIDPKLLEALKIDKVVNQKIGELSGGQQQRVSIARVLAKKPKIIFADEPTGNLDQATAKEVMGVIFDYVRNNKAALVLVTHDDDLAKLCDDGYQLANYTLTKI
ncbi:MULTISPECIES: ABC transporter ATP-binding protein [Campylobacter]|uniref:ABC transporter ATP-binding protein n=1 Tax=Campylobacter TaxID=194 RepID=UPI000A3428F8|nr:MULTISPECIES: ABC transporter ATP-binding protein [Campylobacter]MBE6429694.1 ABC transporter ATP-binding protein [Campylobacter sp.]MBQ8609418.1 ABC transporter ATP-binding protein [Campylobacter sp.]MDL0105201.1 ABC transporter ATP-binding protein [Campylobacter ovis]MDL0106620.1 ABC transporter ATP-binding protein [Campylobacter ovis]